MIAKPALLGATATELRPPPLAPARTRRRSLSGVRRPATHRLVLLALLAATAGAYLVNLTASGDANSFYAAAVQAGTKSWKAFLFGSIDASNFITVDKPPASLWVMEVFGRIFGFSSASMLVPQVLEGVAAVGLLFAAVRRWFGTTAGFAAGALLALTPVAALMFRFNNPDALLVLLLVAGAYCLTRAIERAGTRWVIAAGTMIGLAFLAKMMQAFLVLPAFALVYMLAAPTGLRRRATQTLLGGLAIVLSAGWWVALVAVWPVGSRPMIDGSPTNNIFNLILGYNGLGRIFGSSGPGGGGGRGGGGGGNFSGATGPLRLFNDLMGGQASWLLPAALLALVLGLWATRRAPRTDRTRAAVLLWGGWLIVSALVFSLGSGVIHTYYTVALAPAIAALVAIGGRMLWDRRRHVMTLGLAVAAVLITAVWAVVLLDRTPHWEPWLRPLVLAAAGAFVLAALATRFVRGRRLAGVAVTLALFAALTGPVAYAAETISTAHSGSIPSAGPSAGGGIGGGPGGSRGGASRAGGESIGGLRTGGRPAGAPSGGAPSGGAPGGSRTGALPGGSGTGGFPGRRSGGTGAGAGGPGATTVTTALKQLLSTDSSRYRWVAATSGSQSAASIELATGGLPLMAIGGFNNEGGNLSLQRFEAYVAAGDIHYYIASGGGASGGGAAGGPGGGGGGSASILSWVESHFEKVTVGGQTVYDLTHRTG